MKNIYVILAAITPWHISQIYFKINEPSEFPQLSTKISREFRDLGPFLRFSL